MKETIPATPRKATLRETLLLFATGRSGIFVINALICLISLYTLWFMVPLLNNAVDNITELEDASEYLGVILIGYGVAIEERHALMKIFRLYPKFFSELQEYIDELCHEYGLCYLLLGLALEMCVACIKIPNNIINTANLEYIVFSFSVFFLSWNTLLMFRQCIFLIVRRKDA